MSLIIIRIIRIQFGALGLFMKHSFIIPGTSNKPLAEKISKAANISVGKTLTGRFSNGEAQIRVEEEIYGNTFYVVQSLLPDSHVIRSQVNPAIMRPVLKACIGDLELSHHIARHISGNSHVLST